MTLDLTVLFNVKKKIRENSITPHHKNVNATLYLAIIRQTLSEI
jgi:hypothetical protein